MKINNNIQETLLSFPTSKLLKEAGFDVSNCSQYWELQEKKSKKIFLIKIFEDDYVDLNHENANVDDMMLVCLAPTQQLAIDWIRVNFGIHIWVETVLVEKAKLPYKYEWFCLKEGVDELLLPKHLPYHTPEEAKEAALEYCLINLILKK